MRVIRDRILVRRITGQDETTQAGIIIPRADKSGGRDTQLGEVLQLGPDVEELTVGDHVYFGYHVGWFVVGDGDELIVINDKDVVAVTTNGSIRDPSGVED